MELSLTDAARLLNKTPRQVRYLIRQGKLAATKVNGRWRLQSEALPLSESQLRSKARQAEALRETLDEALGPSGRLAGRRYSVRDLQAFSAARQLWARLVDTLGEAHEATRALRAALVALGQGCHRFHDRDKREAFAAAREHAAQAAVVALLSDVEGVEGLVDSLEEEVLAANSGLVRRAERRAGRASS